ncbi:MAG: FHA domain-containing protein [Deltaproteobacteria bacterium]|nr:FHA domain-containing protein [Deltaproteobacteria bacterium]
MPRVVISIGDKVIASHTLSKDRPLVVGRSTDADVFIPNLSVSRRHAKVYWRNGLWIYQDTGSTNGSFADGERITVHMLAPGKQVQLGKVLLKFEATKEPDAVNPRAAFKMDISGIFKDEQTGPIPQFSKSEGADETVVVRMDSLMPKAQVPRAPPPYFEYAGTTPPRKVPLDKDRLTLGKGETDDVKVEGMLVSAGHATIEKRPDGSWHLVAVKKFPAVSVNGIKVTEQRLKWDDYIDLGNTRLWFRKGR